MEELNKFKGGGGAPDDKDDDAEAEAEEDDDVGDLELDEVFLLCDLMDVLVVVLIILVVVEVLCVFMGGNRNELLLLLLLFAVRFTRNSRQLRNKAKSFSSFSNLERNSSKSKSNIPSTNNDFILYVFPVLVVP